MKPTDIAAPDYFHKVVDCQWACPAHTPVPEYIRLIAQGRYSDAYMPSVLTGANLANRDLIYLGVSGDGDSASIGFGQFAHSIRRAVNMAISC